MPLRERFPIFQSKTYINSCSHGALSMDVRNAYESYLTDRDQYGAHWEYWVEKLETLRKLVGKLINADSDEVAITSSLSDGLNALASSVNFNGDRNRVVLTDFDFPTTAQIWRAQEQRGAKITCVSASADGRTIPLEHFEQSIDDRTLIVSVPHICYRNGSKLDIAPIIELAHHRGALVFLDCYQSIGTTPIDVKHLDADFTAGGMLKYLISSSGAAFLYVKENLIESLNPTTSGWFSQADINAMDIYHNEPAANARRFESGTMNVPNIYAAIAGLNIMQEVGIKEIEAHNRDLTNTIIEWALGHGFQLAMPAHDDLHGPLITLKTNDMYKLVGLLADDGIITSCRDNNLRISPHFYNNQEDISLLFDGLMKHRTLLN